MDLGEAVRTRLLAASGVTDLVVDRVSWGKRPQGGALPALVLYAVGGSLETPDLQDEQDFVETRIQCSALASTHLEAHALAKAATDALMDDASIGTDPDVILFWGADRERPIDLGSDTPDGFVHNITQDVILRHTPAA